MTVACFSRRAFLGCAGAISGAALLPMRADDSNRLVEYVATADSIDVYRKNAGKVRKLQSIASQHPSSLALDSSGRYLFAVNEIDDFQGLPTGSVESYRVEPANGHLALISRIPLSLSATMPRQLALAPDRRFLVVAVYGGGLYNVLSISSNGEIGNVTQVIKEIGCSVRPHHQSTAHPHSVAFHPSGQFLFSSDQGADRISVFRIDGGQMTCVQRLAAVPGSGPAGLAIESSGSHLVVKHEFNPAISRYRFDPTSELLFRLS